MTKSDSRRSRWDEEDRALLRTLGGRISQIIHGEDLDVPDLQRRDELGILANMLSRLARELSAARRRDRSYHAELEQRVIELQAAYATQERLLATIRELSSPILEPYEGLVLVPIVGALDEARVAAVIPALLDHVARRRPQVVLVHVTDPPSMNPASAALLLRVEQSAGHFGARTILSGWPPGADAVAGVDLALLTPCADLQEALCTALELVGCRITR